MRTSILNPTRNPFTVEPGLIPSTFGGRGRELRDARVTIDRLEAGRNGGVLVIEGLRGVGKTSIMAEIRAIATERGIVAVHTEMGRDAERVLHERLGDALRRLGGSGRLRRFAGRLRTVRIGPVTGEIEAIPDRPMVLADGVHDLAALAADQETGALLTIDEAHEDAALACQVMRGLHEAAQDGAPIAAWFAGLPGTHAAMADELTYVERVGVVELGLSSGHT